MNQDKKNQPKFRPYIPDPNHYEINRFEDSEGNYSPSYTCFVEHEYLDKDKILKITWQSDSASDDEVIEFIKERYPKLNPNDVKRIYHMSRGTSPVKVLPTDSSL